MPPSNVILLPFATPLNCARGETNEEKGWGEGMEPGCAPPSKPELVLKREGIDWAPPTPVGGPEGTIPSQDRQNPNKTVVN